MSSWTWLDSAFDGLDDEAYDAEMERREPIVEELAKMISDYRRDEEQTRFRFEAEYDEPGFHRPSVYEIEFEDSGDHAKAAAAEALYEIRKRADEAAKEARIQALEAQLHALGARMCRPYEHWNEDEKYMEYMERDREY